MVRVRDPTLPARARLGPVKAAVVEEVRPARVKAAVAVAVEARQARVKAVAVAVEARQARVKAVAVEDGGSRARPAPEMCPPPGLAGDLAFPMI